MNRRDFLMSALATFALSALPNKLGFGFMRLPVKDPDGNKEIDYDQLKKMVDLFIERGFTYFDTAWMYMDYESEIAVRETVVKRYPRDRFTVASKLPVSYLKSAADQEEIFNKQLEKTGLEYFDYYLVHNINSGTIGNVRKYDSFKFLAEKKMEEVLKEYPEVEFVQLQINYVDWDSASVQSRRCYEVAQKYNKPVIVMEPVKGGMLAAVPPSVEKVFKDAEPNMSVASWAVRYAASLEGVMMVLSGMSTLNQVEDNTSYMQHFKPLDEKEKKVVEEAVRTLHAEVSVPCTACKYCVEFCPMKIAIPDYFALYNAAGQERRGRPTTAQKEAYEALAKDHGRASACIGCRMCEKHCPQHIEISRRMKDVAALFDA